MKKMKQNYLKVKHLKFQNLVASFPEQLLLPCISLEMSYLLPSLKFPNFQHDLLFFYQVPRRLGLSYFVIFLPTTYFVHKVGGKLASSLDILHFRGNHFPTKLANFVSIRISDSQVLLHFRVYFNLFFSFQSQKIIAITI